ncbi:hypothetical protein [Ligilactobacillus aviarius]|uniref:hypothetical protein n=1 Tax=Ligilactobacillus aviarius TaxID=1606 RepID=UPI0024B92367|nr:hypothetical protein [Ligilactobacillus aviarius]
MSIVFNHGDSEAILIRALCNRFRAPKSTYFPRKNTNKRKNTKSSNIQVNGLKKSLEKAIRSGCIETDSTIITIMDLDDCNKQMQEFYKSGSNKIFSPIKNFSDKIAIFPIFNNPNLDVVLRKLGYPIPDPLKNKNDFYRKFFDSWDRDSFIDLKKRCEGVSYTNLNKLIDLISIMNS